MIRMENRFGTVEISPDYFASLVGHAASSCFGVAGMVVSSPSQGIRAMTSKREIPDKGVSVRFESGALVIDLHIEVTYGVNISAIVKSIVSEVRYAVEQSTGLSVQKINVYVDSMKAE